MKTFPAVLVLLLAGCPKPPVPPVTPSDPAVYPWCVLPEVRASDICDGLFTSDGHACAACKNVGGGGCIDPESEIYCIKGYGCLDDPECLPPDVTRARRGR
jgi:hypothetical protein